jgi:uncharacterized membrane protein
MKRIFNYFLQGLLFTVPIIATFYVLIKLIVWVDSLLPFQIPIKLGEHTEYEIPGLGLIVIFLVVSFFGFIGTRYIRNPFFAYAEGLIEKAPLTKVIYTSVKDLISAFVGEKKRFNHPVLVRLEKESDIHRVGFITKDDLTELGIEKEKVAVYLPFSYGFNGELVILPRENVRPLDASGTDMMKFIISGGVTEIS